MRKIALMLVLLTACRSASTSGPTANGATSQRTAVERFLAAAQVGDIQGLSTVWGDETTLTRDRTPREAFEQRAIIVSICLKHDGQRVAEPQNVGNGRFSLMVDVIRGATTVPTQFTVAKNGANRWFVQNFDIQTLQNKGMCQR